MRGYAMGSLVGTVLVAPVTGAIALVKLVARKLCELGDWIESRRYSADDCMAMLMYYLDEES